MDDDTAADQRAPHRRSPNVPVSAAALRALGVLAWKLDPEGPAGEERLQAIRAVRGYTYEARRNDGGGHRAIMPRARTAPPRRPTPTSHPHPTPTHPHTPRTSWRCPRPPCPAMTPRSKPFLKNTFTPTKRSATSWPAEVSAGGDKGCRGLVGGSAQPGLALWVWPGAPQRRRSSLRGRVVAGQPIEWAGRWRGRRPALLTLPSSRIPHP